jgi:hypothetical protein
MRRAHHQEILRPSEAFKSDAQQLAHDAAPAIGPDQPRRRNRLGLAIGVDRHGNAVGVLREPGDPVRKPNVHAGVPAQDIELDRGEPVLLEM